MKICVFCASGANMEEKYISAMRDLGSAIGKHGHTLVFGGYDMGLMGVVAHSVHDAGGRVVGVVPENLGRFATRTVFDCDETLYVPDLSERKAKMVELSDGFVTAPGGFGTLDEFFDIMAIWKATGASRPTVLFNVDGFYDDLDRMLAKTVAEGLMSDSCLDYYHLSRDIDDVMAYMERSL